MVKVITYGTYDLLHHGHIRLLERAKALGDYLIVGVTSDDFDRGRGKINIQQSVIERIEAIKETGLADEIIVEEYEGQKIDDIRRLDVSIFAIGSDWKGKFDYLKEYCDVIYLERTEGVSSSQIRSADTQIKLGFIGDYAKTEFKKYIEESSLVNGLSIVGLSVINGNDEIEETVYEDYKALIEQCDAVYISSHPSKRYEQVKYALECGKHVLCKSPVAIKKSQSKELYELAKSKNLIFADSIKTAYATAYNRLLLLAKSGRIGDVVSVDVVCTSLHELKFNKNNQKWNSITSWAPVGLLPIFQLLGIEFDDVMITSKMANDVEYFDVFTKIDFTYKNAVASVRVGKGYKSEGELIISGTEGYIYVPAPWWKTEYFELRYEQMEDNKRYFYQLDGEGIRYELVAFTKAIKSKKNCSYVNQNISMGIADIMERFYSKQNIKFIE